ncbi:hypothetical protein CYMTET_38365 [Cymbomonas tetramitiformis]|uniref:Uncharacterized protein n=1 Tax=Cymbomonas tetramitiformis TaxID=36881 RepID=A0AAE0CC57_9CHLO|nr:hypothetical protein CYMTET_38365 [Cymbomonas tetramitiformis]
MQRDKQLCAELHAQGHVSLAELVARRLGISDGQIDNARQTVASVNNPPDPSVTPTSDAVSSGVILQPPAPTPPAAAEPVELCEVGEVIPAVDTQSDTARRTQQAFGKTGAPLWARHFDDAVVSYLFPTGF